MSFRLSFKLRWPNTVLARAFADAIQRAQEDYKNKHVVNRAIILFIQKPHYLRYLCSVLMALVSYYKDMLGKVTTQKKNSNSNNPVVRILRKLANNSSETTWMSIAKNLNFDILAFFGIFNNRTYSETIYEELRNVKILLKQCWQKGFNVNS